MTFISERAWEGSLGNKGKGDTERGLWGKRYLLDRQTKRGNSMVWALRGLQDPEETQTSRVKVEVMPF